MCAALVRQGFRTTLFATPAPEGVKDWARVLRDYGIEEWVEAFWMPASRGKWRVRWAVMRTTMRTARRFSLCYTRSPIAAAACVLCHRACVYEMHSPRLPRFEAALLAAIRRSDRLRIVAISAVLADIVSDRYRIPRQRIIVEHDACRLDGDSPHDEGIGSRRLEAVYVGSFYPGRGIDLIRRLADTHADVDFLAVGGAPEDLVKPAPQNLRLRGRVPHRDVPAVLRTADVLLMPYGSRVTIDGAGDTSQFCSPLKLFEYLAAGRAIVSSRLPSIQEVLRDGENALLAAPDDLNEWSAALEALKQSAQLREQLAAGALRTAGVHTWDARVRRILEVPQ
jgi:glycosyltransferase involved in cell wall biosynthesis